jgi:transcriptional regulator with XRE-family HTH domain
VEYFTIGACIQQVQACFLQWWKIPNIAVVKTYSMSDKVVHQGKAVKRIREILGKKQEDLALDLGITQQAVSLLEGKETIDQKLLSDVARVLKVPVDAITRFNEDATISIVANTFNADSAAYVEQYKPTIHPLDKMIELYERMLKEKDEIIAKLQQGDK